MPIPPTKEPSWLVKETWPAVVALIIGGAGGIVAFVKEANATPPSGLLRISPHREREDRRIVNAKIGAS